MKYVLLNTLLMISAITCAMEQSINHKKIITEKTLNKLENTSLKTLEEELKTLSTIHTPTDIEATLKKTRWVLQVAQYYKKGIALEKQAKINNRLTTEEQRLIHWASQQYDPHNISSQHIINYTKTIISNIDRALDQKHRDKTDNNNSEDFL